MNKDDKPKRVRRKPNSTSKSRQWSPERKSLASKRSREREALRLKELQASNALREEQTKALKKELTRRFRYTGLDEASVSELAEKYGRSERAVIARAAAQGIIIDRRTNVAFSDPQDTQYGVLQPAANLFAGCLNLWLWVILIIVVAAIVTLVSYIF